MFIRGGRSLVIVVGLVVLGLAAPARAQPDEPTPRQRPCYDQTDAAGNPTSTRRCLIGRERIANARIARGNVMFIFFDQPLVFVPGSPDPALRIELPRDDQGQMIPGTRQVAVMLEKPAKSLADLVVTTEGYPVTIQFEVVQEGFTTQLHIAPDQEIDNSEVRRRVAAARAELAAEYDAKLKTLDRRAAALAHEHILRDVHAGFVSKEPDLVPTRNDWMVLRLRQVIYLGTSRFLRVEVDNRHRELLALSSRSFAASGSEAGTPVSVPAVCDTQTLRARERTMCTVALRYPASLARGQKVWLRVTSNDGARSATLAAIPVAE
jgi:hypothetical protein